MPIMKFFSNRQKREILHFIACRENRDGGYGLASGIPPDLEDTFYSLRTLQELGVRSASAKTRQYLREVSRHGPAGSFRASCHLAELFDNYGLGRLPDHWQAISAPPAEDITEFYYYISFYRTIGRPIRLDAEMRRFLLKQTPESLRYLPETSRYVQCMKQLRVPFDEPRFVSWIQDRQWYDGGFGIVKFSTAFLEHAYLALVALKAMNAKPRDSGKCRGFVIRCYRSDGGFGRQYQTVPTPEDTYYAVRSLKILQIMAAR